MRVTSAYLRELSRIAVPMALQMLIFTSSTTIDAIMIGQLGDVELAAVGLADRATFLLAMVTVGAANASGTLGAQQLGAKNEAAFRRSIASGMLVCGVMGALSALSFWLFARPIVSLGSTDPQVIGLGGTYLTIVGLSMASAGVLLPLEVGLRCIHRAGVATQYSALEAALNFGLNYCLIFGNLGFPEMGVAGAAIGTLIARVVHVLALVIHIRAWEARVAVTWADLVAASEKTRLRLYLRIANPLIINHCIWGAGVFAFQLLYGRMGTAELAAMTVIWTFQRLVLVQLAAVGHAGAVLVGHAIGAGDTIGARRSSWQNLSVSLSVSCSIALLLYLIREAAVGTFSGLDDLTRDLVFSVFPIFLIEAMARAITVSVIVGGLKAGGDVRYALWLDLFGAWIVGLPLAAVGAFVLHWPLFAVYALSICEEVSKAVIALLRLRGSAWMHELTETETDDPVACA